MYLVLGDDLKLLYIAIDFLIGDKHLPVGGCIRGQRSGLLVLYGGAIPTLCHPEEWLHFKCFVL